MAGYFNYSMSNNAVVAYENGEKPFSIWQKKPLLEGICEQIDALGILGLDFEVIQKLRVDELKKLFLKETCPHHTSKFYNLTKFYQVHVDENFKNEDIYNVIENRTPIDKSGKKQQEPFYYADVTYGVCKMKGRKKKFTFYDRQAIIQGNNAYILPNGDRKLVSGKRFRIKKKYQSRPSFYDKKAVDSIVKERNLNKASTRKK